MANQKVTLLRYAKIPGLGWRRGRAVVGKTGKIKPNYMLIGKGKNKQTINASEGHYQLRYFEGKQPRYKDVGNDPTEALAELARADRELKFRNSADAVGYVLPVLPQVKQKLLTECGREFLELKNSPSLKLSSDTLDLYRSIVEEFVPVCGKTVPEEITEADVIHYCDVLDKRYADRTRATRYKSLRGFLFYCGLEPKRLITPSVHKRLKTYEKKKRFGFTAQAKLLLCSASVTFITTYYSWSHYLPVCVSMSYHTCYGDRSISTPMLSGLSTMTLYTRVSRCRSN